MSETEASETVVEVNYTTYSHHMQCLYVGIVARRTVHVYRANVKVLRRRALTTPTEITRGCSFTTAS